MDTALYVLSWNWFSHPITAVFLFYALYFLPMNLGWDYFKGYRNQERFFGKKDIEVPGFTSFRTITLGMSCFVPLGIFTSLYYWKISVPLIPENFIVGYRAIRTEDQMHYLLDRPTLNLLPALIILIVAILSVWFFIRKSDRANWSWIRRFKFFGWYNAVFLGILIHYFLTFWWIGVIHLRNVSQCIHFHWSFSTHFAILCLVAVFHLLYMLTFIMDVKHDPSK
ncbi:MAG: hypothetical protein ABIE68_04265 [bacterium]